MLREQWNGRRCARQRVLRPGPGALPNLSESPSRHRGDLLPPGLEAEGGRRFAKSKHFRAALLCADGVRRRRGQRAPADFEALPFAPRSYVCYRAPAPVSIDGKLDEPAWAAAPGRRRSSTSRVTAALAPVSHSGEDVVGRRVFLCGRRDGGAGHLGDADRARLGDFSRHDFEIFIDPDGDTTRTTSLK